MKRIFLLGLIGIMMLGMVGCGVDPEKQEAVSAYVNEVIPSLEGLEKTAIDSYNSVLGENYTDDDALYTEFKLTTVNSVQALHDAAVNASATITDEEVAQVHAWYVSYTSGFLNALDLILQAIEEQDSTISAQANEVLSTATSDVQMFRTKLQELADKYEVELQ